MAEIDPVMFGKLCANVENTHTKLCEFIDTVKDHVERTNTKLESHETTINEIKNDSAVKKGAVLGMLGGGALAGAALPEGLKKIFEAIGKVMS